jgi:hypothetical protein
LDDPAAPVNVEFLWSEDRGDGTYRVLSPPYYVTDVAVGDVIEVTLEPEVHFVRVLAESGHSILRVFLESGSSPDLFFTGLRELGAMDSPTERPDYFVIDIPASLSIVAALDYLTEKQESGQCDWVPGSISRVHAMELHNEFGADVPDWVPPR